MSDHARSSGEALAGNPARAGYRLSCDAAEIDVDAVHAYLVRSYWAEGIPRAIVERAIRGSLCCGIFANGGTGIAEAQVAFSRVVTDRATFAYLCDVYVLEEHRGRGLSRWMMEALMAHPELQDMRRFFLATRDAHDLYRKFGFVPLAKPDMFLEIVRPGLYLKPPFR